MTNAKAAWPSELKVAHHGKMLEISFEDGSGIELPAELLRVLSPSAEVRGHSRKERKIVGGKRDVAIVGVDPVGTYAVKLRFDDMHATGIYTWDYLHELGREQAERWATYLTELAAKGMSREKAEESLFNDH